MQTGLWFCAGILNVSIVVAQPSSFQVEKVLPRDGATHVNVDPLIQIHTSEKFDFQTVNSNAVSLIDATGNSIPIRFGTDLGGVITISVEKRLQPNHRYTIRIDAALKSAKGKAITPGTYSFTTTDNPADDERLAPKHFRFSKTRIDRRDGVCGLALATTADLFACTWDGTLIRYRLDDQGQFKGRPEIVLQRNDRRFLALAADRNSTRDAVSLWLSHDSLAKKSLGPNDFSGTISKIEIRDAQVQVEDFVRGLPTGDHPATGLVFGPSGKLYVSQGALTMLGDKPNLKETPLSAAVLEIDLTDDAFSPARRPLDVRTTPPTRYDASTGPVQIFASGIREAYDLCWHTNGQLYAGVNMNDTKEKTPQTDGLPAVNVRPAEMMIRIVRGKYYGHPNPSRGEWVLLGGNPTTGVDPWEVSELPVGTAPDPRFDPSLLIRNLEKDKGPSADGCVEWTRPGPLERRLLFCFYTATRGIHSYRLSQNGGRVLDHQPLLNEQGDALRFGAPLDIVFHPAGRLYVADFSAPERGDSGQEGGVWLATPKTP